MMPNFQPEVSIFPALTSRLNRTGSGGKACQENHQSQYMLLRGNQDREPILSPPILVRMTFSQNLSKFHQPEISGLKLPLRYMSFKEPTETSRFSPASLAR